MNGCEMVMDLQPLLSGLAKFGIDYSLKNLGVIGNYIKKFGDFNIIFGISRISVLICSYHVGVMLNRLLYLC